MKDTKKAPVTSTQLAEISRIFELQKSRQFEIGAAGVAQRKEKLNRLHRAVLKYQDEIREALYKDLKKPQIEVDLVEIYQLTVHLKLAKRKLSKWMSKKRVPTPLPLIGSRSYIVNEPKGVVLIMAPWNFPVLLCLGPLVSAIAAGNCAVIKPSEHTPHASAVVKKLIRDTFQEHEVAVVEGGVDTAKELLGKPFNHVFFTGSPAIGKLVMKAAAEHLSSVTLELGGKSPVIVLDSANIDLAAKRIAGGKFINSGQVCIAPDHVYVAEERKAAFMEALKKHMRNFYTDEPVSSDSFARMANHNHHANVKAMLEEAVKKGARVEAGGSTDDKQRYIAPTVLTHIPEDARIMKEEIFGPLLPVMTFSSLEELVGDINKKEKPLALYIYGKNRKQIRYVLNHTRAGGGCINHNSIQFTNMNLPFGGSNNSGSGKSHGVHGFREFSNARAIVDQRWPSTLDLLTPPYNKFKQRLIDLTIKYF